MVTGDPDWKVVQGKVFPEIKIALLDRRGWHLDETGGGLGVSRGGIEADQPVVSK